MKKLEDLEQHECRYPLGEFNDPPEFFCADRTYRHYSYCPKHLVLCIKPDKESKKKT